MCQIESVAVHFYLAMKSVKSLTSVSMSPLLPTSQACLAQKSNYATKRRDNIIVLKHNFYIVRMNLPINTTFSF